MVLLIGYGETLVHREVARARLLAVSFGKSYSLPEMLVTLLNIGIQNEVSRLANAPCIGSVKGKFEQAVPRTLPYFKFL